MTGLMQKIKLNTTTWLATGRRQNKTTKVKKTKEQKENRNKINIE